MIKVIVGYKIKSDVDIKPILFKLRTHAMTFPGFIGAENLVSTEDSSIVAMISTWEKPEDWHEWESSMLRQEILREARMLLLEEPRVTVYQPISTTTPPRWIGQRR
jgi:heme-degrading monooxygenase HmoA